MLAAVAGIGGWTWIIVGLACMLVELFAPGLFFIWLGLAALATGAAVFAFGLGWTSAALLFAALAVVSVIAGRAVTRRPAAEPDPSGQLNRMGRELVGKVLPLDSRIENGVGRVRIGDTVWRVSGEDMVAGASVRIVGIEGSTLKVKPA
jgi:inner membrane protein